MTNESTDPDDPSGDFSPPVESGDASPVFAWLQLFRLPNVFTAAADVLMGYLFTHATRDPRLHIGLFDPPLHIGLLVAASCLIYTAGMVLNDVFDLEIDRAERPGRPLPSGRIGIELARKIGFALLIGGVTAAAGASVVTHNQRPIAVAVVLALIVVLYDWRIKRTAAGPLAMGACRALNVLLGMSLAGGPWTGVNYVVAAGLGVYIVGLTWFARSEATESGRASLAFGLTVLLAGLGLLAWHIQWLDRWDLVATLRLEPNRWYLLWGMLAALIGWRCVWAIFEPRAALVQAAVRQGILSIIVIDAVVVYAQLGEQAAIVVLLLLLPTMLLGRWVYST